MEVKAARMDKQKKEPEQDSEETVGALVSNYDLMLHYMLGHMCRADGAYPPRPDGAKVFDFFAGPCQHRSFFVLLR